MIYVYMRVGCRTRGRGRSWMDVRCCARERAPRIVVRRSEVEREVLKGRPFVPPRFGPEMATEEKRMNHERLTSHGMAGDDHERLRSTVSPTLSSLPMSM